MNNFIKLTRENGCPTWININHIICIDEESYGASIITSEYMSDDFCHCVRETPEEIIQLIEKAHRTIYQNANTIHNIQHVERLD